MRTFQHSLEMLWQEEDQLVEWAKEQLHDPKHQTEHVEMIELYMDTVDLLRKQHIKGDRKYALISLFMRTSDNFGVALRLAMSGRYRFCAMVLRDQMETGFLIDYLMEAPGRPERWLASGGNNPDYKPYKIREALDVRDRLRNPNLPAKSRRSEQYAMLSTLGAHPGPLGMTLHKDGAKALNLGPFKQRDMLKECVEEAARSWVLVTGRLLEFCSEFERDGQGISSPLALRFQKIHEQYFSPNAHRAAPDSGCA